MDDALVFIDEDIDESSQERWKILVVDDDESVHAITKVALQNKLFDGKKLELISAMSAQEAKELFNQHDDIVMALVDVIMETPDAGLQLVDYIRQDLNNSLIRLVLRTGQPDQVPEDEILDRYDINDYKEKTELTSQKLYTLIRISIKQYEQLARLQYQEKLLLIKTRNAQMGEMLSMIAHQWRQPLSSISSVINNIKIKLITQNYTEEVLLEKSDEAEQLIQHLSKTISDFRRFFLPDKKKSSFLIQSVLDKSLEIISPSLELKDIKVITNNRSTTNIISFENELQQVLLNILKNAQDALEINKVENPLITINSFDEENKTYIQILDNAGGINPSVIDNVFDPYFTTKDNTNGTGLGLYMSKVIIEEHCKGKISAENTNEGALFCIVLNLEGNQ